MKIVVINASVPALLNLRGPLLAALASSGHEVIACAPGEEKDVTARLAQLGVRYKAIELDRTGLNPIKDLYTLLCLSKLLHDLQPDIVLSYNHKPVICGSLAGRLVGVPRRFSGITGLGLSTSRWLLGEQVTSSRSPFRRRIIGAMVRRLYRLSLGTNEAVFFQNPDDLAHFIKSGLVKDPKQAVLTNGSGVDLEYFSEVPPYTQGPVFLLIGRLLEEKGIIEYIKAARILKMRHPQATFRLLGAFDSHPSCIGKTQIEGWRQEGIIEYLGEVKDVRPFIANTSVFVLPSYREGTPKSTLEAMAMGRPVITSDTPGCRETVVDGKSGFLVPTKDVAALAEAMEKFILRPGLIESMGRFSRRIAVEKYDADRVNATVMETMGLTV